MRLPVFVTTVLFVVSQLVGCSRTGDGSNSRTESTSRVEDTRSGENTFRPDDEPDDEPDVESPATLEPTEETQASKQFKAQLAAYEAEGGARLFAKRFLQLAEQHPEDPAAADALIWVVSNVRGKPETTQALDMLATHHRKSNQLGPACKDIAGSRSIAAEKLLRAILDENPDEQIRAHACFYLASLLDLEASLVSQIRAEPDLAPRVLQYYGKEYGEHLASLEPVVLEEQRIEVYRRILTTFADVKLEDEKLGVRAEKMLFQIRHLSIGKTAPDIVGEDIDGNVFKLSDFRGKVVMLTFWGHW